MTIRVSYYGQTRIAAGKEGERLEVASGITLGAVIRSLAERYGDGMSWLLLTEEGTPRRSVMFAVNEESVESVDSHILNDDDCLSIFPAVSGG